MAASTLFSLRSFNFHYNPKVLLSEDIFHFKPKTRTAAMINGYPKQFFLTSTTCTLRISSNWIPPGALSSTVPAADYFQSILEDECSLAKSHTNGMDLNRVDYVVLVLHESARSFSLAMQTLDIARMGPPLLMAWSGVDVNAWHRKLSYQVAVYALLKSAIEVELFLSHNRNSPMPVKERKNMEWFERMLPGYDIFFFFCTSLSPTTINLEELIESQLNTRNPQLVQWFRIFELPRLAGLFMPLFKKWSVEYAGSGVAGTITAITCCASVGSLCSLKTGCPSLLKSTKDMIVQLMNFTQDIVSVNKLHPLAIEAGFEEDFLFHCGSKILPSKNVEDIEFWIGLVQRKLCVAFKRESVTIARQVLSNKVEENSLAILGLFAYLAKESRLFLLRHNIKDVDDQINDFLSCLENGILSIYPEFSTLSEYQLLMEVIIDEIGWLDFYAAYNCHLSQEGRRSKNHLIQAEQEIILYAVFTVCYDVISGFAHYSSSTQQTVDDHLLTFLLQSQSLLTTCLEFYWAAYDKTCDQQKTGERNLADYILINGVKSTSFVLDARLRPEEFRKGEKPWLTSSEIQVSGSSGSQPETLSKSATPKPKKQNFVKNSALKLLAVSVDVWMGTQLLFVDISDAMRLIVKKFYGHKATKRESRKMKRTMSDIATLIPVTILMLIPVSAVGHAAIFAAIKKYMPFLIPSPYSDERVNIVKQLRRSKKMKVQHVSNENGNSKAAPAISH